MKQSVERVITAPLASSTPIKSENSGSNEKEAAGNEKNTSVSTIDTCSADAKDVSEAVSPGFVTLDVTLPDGLRSDVIVDYNTPMLDLLVSLAARSRLSPTGLYLVLVSEHSGKPTSYTPNQTVGSLEGRVVHIVSKDAISGKPVNRAPKKEKPFEVTQRFTVNLPTGQKTVLRVSPLTTIGDLVISACKEKGLDLDLDKYVLQLPKKPGIPIDPGATIQQAGIQEVNLVSLEHVDRNYAMSMPDLSKLPPSANDPRSFAQLNGQPKKKRGFLSFLGKKDKKFKTEVRRSLVLKSTSHLDVNTPPITRTSTLPDQVSPVSDTNHQVSRPKSMFVSSDTLPLNDKLQEQHPQTLVAPPRKKRRAPEPPVLVNSHILPQQQNLSLNESEEINKEIKESLSALQEQTESNQEEEVPSTIVSSQSASYKDIFPDTNGQHDMNLNGCDPPEINDTNQMKINTSINVNSLTSTDSIPGDSKTYLVSDDVVVKDTKLEKAALKMDTRTPEPSEHSSSSGDSNTSPRNKKIKAPIPPSPVFTSSSATMESASASLSSTSVEAATSSGASESPETGEYCVHLVQTHTETSSTFASQSQLESPSPENQKELSTSNTSGKHLEPLAEDQPDSSNISAQNVPGFSESNNESAAMDFNDILNGVVFEEEPWSLQLALANKAGQQDSMMMMETASVTSEDIDEIDSSSHAGRPCAFIPPPPPSEPPPPEQHPVDFEPLTSTSAPIFVDKGTEVNEDNTSLANSSAKSSPGRASFGGLNEMALFIEQMNSITVENQVDQEDKLSNDSMDKTYISVPLSSDSGPQTSHLQAASWDTSSEMDPLTTKENQKLSNMEMAHTIEDSEDIQIPNEETCVAYEEIMNIITTLPPPPQFEDKVDIVQNTSNIEDKVDIVQNTSNIEEKAEEKAEEKGGEDEDEEEFFTEVIEELIIPLGPNGYDFTAARKKTDVELATEPSKATRMSNINEIIRAEPTFIGHQSSRITPFYQRIPKPEQTSLSTLPSNKEEFVLTTEDLSKVTLLPSRPQVDKSSMESRLSFDRHSFLKSHPSVESQPFVTAYSKSQVMPNCDHSIARSTTTGRYSHENIQPLIIENGFTSKSKTQVSVSKEKPTTLPKLPAVASSVHTDSVPVSFDDDNMYSNDPLLVKSRPHLLMNSHSNPLRRSAVDRMRGADYSTKDVYSQRSFNAGAGSDAVADSGEQPSSVTSGYNADTQDQQDVLQRQYLALKSQIQHWQEQLAWNQSLLASQAVGSEHQAGHFQQLSDKLALQQEMAMQQLQSTLLALQQQQHQQHMPASGQDNGELSAELPARIHQPVAGAAEPTYVAAASPPATVPPPQKQSSALKSGVNTLKKRPKTERELGPREQLMIAIRTFSKRGLKSVPIEMTRWTPSALS